MWHPIALIVFVLGFASSAAADPLACYRAGTAAMKADDFAGAARAFRAAAGDPGCDAVRDGLLFNEAAALDRLAEAADTAEDDAPLCRALYAYRRALPVSRAATRPAIEEAIARLSPGCPPAGALRIVCEPAGGTVRLAGKRIERPCPAQFDDLRPRIWRGEVTAAGVTVAFEVDVPSGQRIEHRVVQRAAPALVSAGPEPSAAPAGRAVGEVTAGDDAAGGLSLAPYGWTALALGVASAGVASYAYGSSFSVSEDGEAAIERADRARFDEAQSAYADLETLHLYTAIAAGALITTGALLLYFDDDGDEGVVSTIEPVVGPVSGVRIRFWP